MTIETKDLIEELVQNHLVSLKDGNVIGEDRKYLLSETYSFIDKLNEYEKINDEYYDKSERRRIDEEDRKASRKLEESKDHNLDKLIEIGSKIGVPLITMIVGISTNREFLKMILKFEETGRIVSKPGKEFHIQFPKLLR